MNAWLFMSMLLPLCVAAQAPSTSTPKLKVLCLHGYAQNAQILRDRSGGFRRALKKSQFEMHYVDGPYGCTKDGERESVADADPLRRAWWRGSSAQQSYVGWQQTRDELVELWQREQFDAVLGFSQGAGAAAMLAAELRPAFAILIAGFVPNDRTAARRLLGGSIDVPSLHVYGEADELVEPARSHVLADCFSDANIIMHEGRHCIPSGAAVRKQVVAFLDSL